MTRYMTSSPAQWADLSPLRKNGWEYDRFTGWWVDPRTGLTYPTMKALEIQAQSGQRGTRCTQQ